MKSIIYCTMCAGWVVFEVIRFPRVFYGARYYDPGIGRFIQPDPLVDGVHTTQGFNRYMYVHGNPINMFDSTGYSSEGYTFEIGFGGSEGGYSGGNSGSGYGYEIGGYNITVGMQGNSSEYHTYSGDISSTASYDNTPVEEAGSNSYTSAVGIESPGYFSGENVARYGTWDVFVPDVYTTDYANAPFSSFAKDTGYFVWGVLQGMVNFANNICGTPFTALADLTDAIGQDNIEAACFAAANTPYWYDDLAGLAKIPRFARGLYRVNRINRTSKVGGKLVNSGPIPRSVGAMSRAERLARKLRLNVNSSTTRQILNSLDDTVSDFIGKYRKGSIRSEFPGEFLNKTVEEALQTGGSKVAKLLKDKRFVK